MTPSLRKHPRPSQWLAFVDAGPDAQAAPQDGGARATVEVLTGKVEIGQALHAALAGWVAAALDWPVAQVVVVAPDTRRSPDEGVTSGSLSMQDSGRALAAVAAIVRMRLVADAARRWGVPADAVAWRQGVLTGPAEGHPPRREGVDAASADAVMHEAVTESEWQSVQPLVASHPQASARAATASRHAALASMLRHGGHFIHDLSLPGMVHGSVLHRVGGLASVVKPDAELDRAGRARSPEVHPGACLGRADVDSRINTIRAMPGVLDLVVDGGWDQGLVGVLADGAGRADRAARRLESLLGEADAAGAASGTAASNAAVDPTSPQNWHAHDWPARLVASRPSSSDETVALAEAGQPIPLPEGGRLVEAVYTRGWLAHASIGPSCAIARWSEDRASLEIWTHSQGVFNLRRDLALAWGLDEQAVVVRHVPGAGCYGHNGADDVAFDASWLARQAAGRPVRVTWRREQEWRSAPLGPAMRVQVQAVLDAQGRVVDWRHTFWSPGHSSRPGRSATPSLWGNALREGGAPLPAPIDMPLATGGGGERNAVPGYDWPRWQVIGHRVALPWRASALRSLGAHANVFAAEGLLDEVARLTDRCPWAIRLEALGHDARGAAVLRLARERSGWDARRVALTGIEGAGLGLAYARYKNTGAWCAVVAEVRAEAVLRVVRLTIVADVGQPIHPEGVAQQLEGGAVQAVSWTLKEEIAADAAGHVATATWDDYPIVGFDEMPAIDVHLVPSDEPPLGAGEAACGPTAAALGNALFDALGVRVRDLPLTPDRIVAAMGL